MPNSADEANPADPPPASPAMADRAQVDAAFARFGYAVRVDPNDAQEGVLIGELTRSLPQTGVWYVKATPVIWNVAVYVGFFPGSEPRDEVKRFNFLKDVLKESYVASCGRVGLRETKDHRLMVVCETMLVHPAPDAASCTIELQYRLEQLNSLVEKVHALIEAY